MPLGKNNLNSPVFIITKYRIIVDHYDTVYKKCQLLNY